ncbi:MAG TPA: SpoIIE family protein phosphatase [Vicinamibacterales bacterium]|nr:SpoIIE family protein phosphatase [Vicinamibacterales bacterium]
MLPRPVALAAAIIVVAAAGVYSVGWMYYAGQDAQARLGITPEHRPRTADFVLLAVQPNTPADRAGLRPDDRIVEINGRRLDTPNPFYDAVTRGRPGDVVRLMVERAGQLRTIDVRLEPRPPDPPSRPLRKAVETLLRLYPLAFFLVAGFVLLQRPQDLTAWLLALLFFSLIAAAPVEAERLHPSLRSFVLSFSLLGGVVPAATYAFLAVFPVRSPIDRRVPWLKHALLASALVIVAALSIPVWRAGSMAPLRRMLAPPAMSAYGALMLVYFLAATGLGLASLVMNDLRAPTAEARRRTRVIVWGTIAGLTPISIRLTVSAIWKIDPYEGPAFWIWAPTVLALFLIPLSFAYAVVRYRVLEIPVLLKRSARYLLVQRGFVVLLFLLSAAATIFLAIELPLVLPARWQSAGPIGLVAGAGLGVALAWGGSRLHRRFTERIDRAFFRNAYDARRILEDLAMRAGRAAGREELAAALAQSIDEALHPTSLTIYLERDGDSLETFHGEPAPGLRRLPRNSPDLDVLALEGGPVVQGRNGDRARSFGALAALQAECVSPMLGRDERIAGLLALGPRLSEEPYSNEDRRLLATVCNQAGLALDSISLAERIAERMEVERRSARELEIAKEVQRGLLPRRPPTMTTLECAGACLQARSVGGDYYDFLDLGEGRLGIVLADISGKGISAALLMANLQAYVRSSYAVARDDPAFLHSLNDYLFDASPSSRYATLFLGRYEEGSRRLRYANCGHNPPLVMRADGAVEWLPPTAPVVGLFDRWSCELADLVIGPGDTLVLYTDGITDAIDDAGEFFGEERLVEWVRRNRQLAASALLKTIIDAVTQFTGTVQEDDLTLVIAKGQ